MRNYRTQKEKDTRAKITLKIFLAVAIIAAIITSIAIIASRLSDEALAVLAGAGCGVAAAIPTSLLVVAVSNNRKHSNDKEQPKAPRQQSTTATPPVIVVTPQGLQQQQPRLGYRGYDDYPQAAARPPRKFTIVGDGEYE